MTDVIVGPHLHEKEVTTGARCALLEMAGYNYDVSIALAENGHDVESAKTLSTQQVFGLYLHWNGIIGYTSDIIDALDNVRNMEAV